MAMLAVVLVGSSDHSRGGLIRKKEAIRGRMDEQPQENVRALVGQWRPKAGRPMVCGDQRHGLQQSKEESCVKPLGTGRPK